MYGNDSPTIAHVTLLMGTISIKEIDDVLSAVGSWAQKQSPLTVHLDRPSLPNADGWVFLDAECAWYGDPAFDLAFCLNHLLLKCIWTPAATEQFLESFEVLGDVYLSHVDWEPALDIEFRTAALLPGLLLARIDGASPVEYITDIADKDRVRRAARRMLFHPPETLADICRIYREEAEL